MTNAADNLKFAFMHLLTIYLYIYSVEIVKINNTCVVVLLNQGTSIVSANPSDLPGYLTNKLTAKKIRLIWSRQPNASCRKPFHQCHLKGCLNTPCEQRYPNFTDKLVYVSCKEIGSLWLCIHSTIYFSIKIYTNQYL